MKVTYEFKWEVGSEDTNDEFDLKIFQLANKMYQALSDINDYMRQLRKGWTEDDAEKIEDRISDLVLESGIHDIE